MAKKQERMTEEEKRLLEFAHDCGQIASAETVQDMMVIVPILWEKPEKGGEKSVCDSATA